MYTLIIIQPVKTIKELLYYLQIAIMNYLN